MGLGLKLEAFEALKADMTLVTQKATSPSRSLLLALYGAVSNQDWQRIKPRGQEKSFKQARLLETSQIEAK